MAEEHVEAEILSEEECAVMMFIVSHKHVSSTDILMREDKAFARFVHRWDYPVARCAESIGSHTVGRAIKNDGLLPGGVLRRVDGSKEPDPITHRDGEFTLTCSVL